MEYTKEDTQIFNAFTNYPFDEDPIFNKGKTVIESNIQKKIMEEMKPINQANEIFKFKIYYWTKKYQKQINITKYNKWLRDGRPVYNIQSNNINNEIERILGERISTYDFDNDECFQNGISTLKERFKDNEEHLNMALNNAKIFYLRKLIQSELTSSNENESEEIETTNQNINNNDDNINESNLASSTEIKDSTIEPVTSTSNDKKENIDIQINENETKSNDEEVLEDIIESGKEKENQENDDNKPKYPKSFYEICEMIAKGLPIPGIRQIPNKINEGTPSKPSMKPRPKPWELKRMQYENVASGNTVNTNSTTNDASTNNADSITNDAKIINNNDIASNKIDNTNSITENKNDIDKKENN